MTKNYPYENLSDEEFESLIIRICNELLGIGCKTFSKGKDGAKDSWFEGKSDRFPSESGAWSGKFIIQAKHTQISDASCSDNSFFQNQTSIISKEVDRLKEISKTEPFDNYILFTNRKLTGLAHQPIVTKLKTELQINNVELIGREQLNAYLDGYSFLAEKFGLYKFTSPLRFYEKDLKEIIIVFAEQLNNISKTATNYITNFDIVDKEKKNQLNNLSSEYFEFIKDHSLQYFEKIEEFLRNPINEKYTRYYSNTVSDLKAKIILERHRFNDFMHLIEHLVDFVVNDNIEKLKDFRDIVRVFIHFMYFNCDIGITK